MDGLQIACWLPGVISPMNKSGVRFIQVWVVGVRLLQNVLQPLTITGKKGNESVEREPKTAK